MLWAESNYTYKYSVEQNDSFKANEALVRPRTAQRTAPCSLILRSDDDISQLSSSDFFIIEPTRRTNFTNLFCHETLHVSDSSSVHHQEFIHCTLSDGICHTHSFRVGAGWNRKL